MNNLKAFLCGVGFALTLTLLLLLWVQRKRK
jgi:uncharacterized protein (TIGR03382 family)